MLDTRGTDVGAVGPGSSSTRRVDHQLDHPGGDELDGIGCRAILPHLGHELGHLDPLVTQEPRSPDGGGDGEPEGLEGCGHLGS